MTLLCAGACVTIQVKSVFCRSATRFANWIPKKHQNEGISGVKRMVQGGLRAEKGGYTDIFIPG